MPTPSTSQQTTSNSNTSGTTSNNTSPGWAPQTAALTTAFNQAGGALTNAQGVQGPILTSSDLAGNGALSNNGVNMSTSGTNASATGLSQLTGYDPTKQNNPSSLIDTANQYVAGQNIPAQVKAAMQGATETARDVTMPGIEQNAAISGNTNSSRAGIADGLVQRGLAEQSANMENAMNGQAFGQGLTLASANANNNNQSSLMAANAAAGQGNNAANVGSNVYGGALNNTGTANNINEGNYNSGVSNAYAALQQYMNLIGSKSWGTQSNGTSNSTQVGSGTSNTQTDPGMLSNISSGLGILGAFL